MDNKKKIEQLLKLQNYMEQEFDIPMLEDSAYNEKNKELISVYKLISDLKFKLMD